MRSAAILFALPILAALAGCSNADRIAYATAIPEARITAPSELIGHHRVAGMVLSICGMMLRWRSHRLDQHEKDRG
jgi:hypothetical protein